jgi:hypothetical protein
MKLIKDYSEEELYSTGIYRIFCKSNNKSYIGSASCFKNKNKKRKGFFVRFNTHYSRLIDKKHHNSYLQNAFNKYGEDDFLFEILEYCDPNKCAELEIQYMEKYNSMIYQSGFNIIKQPLSRLNKKNSIEHNLRLSKLYLGKKRPLEVVKKYSNHVLQYNLNNELIGEFYSMSEASRVTGVQRQDIGQSIIGKKCKTAGGFIWKKMKT